ncbi:unnamed protein product, partial [Durusdinium trenchii]
DWRLYGNERHFSVRVANAIARNTAVLVRLLLKWRPTVYVVLENPLSTWLYKLPCFKELLKEASFFFVLTYMGLWGMDILKGTRLASNLPTLASLERRATKKVKAKFQARVARKKARAARAGKSEKCFYTTGQNENGQRIFTHGPDLAATAEYPQRFCTALYTAWARALEVKPFV